MFKENIFRAYDIRGVYGEEFDDEFAEKLGAVAATHFRAKEMVVARDMRPASEKLASRLIAGITSLGCKVVDIGTTSTPLFYFGVIHEGADGGIMVTASHLGDEFGGFKITRAGAVTVGGDRFFAETRDLFGKAVEEKATGEVEVKDLLDAYAEATVTHSGLTPGDIAVPVKLIGNEMAKREARAVMDRLSVPVVEAGEHIAFAFDPDADRLMVHGASGEKIRGDLIGGLIAGYYFPNEKIAYDLRYSRGVLAYLKAKGIETIPSRIGHTLIKAVMREHAIPFCGEQSGHMFFKEMGYVESPLLAAVKILGIIQETGQSIEELVRPIDSWSTTEEINVSFTSRGRALELIEAVREKYSDGTIDDTDGIRVEYPDWGFLLRPSNTESKLRLIVDAKEKNLMGEKQKELVTLLRE